MLPGILWVATETRRRGEKLGRWRNLIACPLDLRVSVPLWLKETISQFSDGTGNSSEGVGDSPQQCADYIGQHGGGSTHGQGFQSAPVPALVNKAGLQCADAEEGEGR
jgi:hypothetical protein